MPQKHAIGTGLVFEVWDDNHLPAHLIDVFFK